MRDSCHVRYGEGKDSVLLQAEVNAVVAAGVRGKVTWQENLYEILIIEIVGYTKWVSYTYQT